MFGHLRYHPIAFTGNLGQLLIPSKGRVFLVHGWWIQLVADGTAASRVIKILPAIVTSHAPCMPAFQSAAVTASQTKTFGGHNAALLNGSPTFNTDSSVGLTLPLPVGYGGELQVSVYNGVVGDLVSGYVVYSDLPE